MIAYMIEYCERELRTWERCKRMFPEVMLKTLEAEESIKLHKYILEVIENE